MSEFWKQVTSIGGGSDPASGALDDLVVADGVESYCGDDATVQFVVVGTDDGLTRKTDDWETTEKPGPDCGTFLVVTDRAVVLLAGNCRDPDVDGDYVQRIPHDEIADVDAASSLLSSSLTLERTDGVRFTIVPTEEEGLNDLVEFIRRAGLRWSAANEVLDDFDHKLQAIESHLAAGELDEASSIRSGAASAISEAEQTTSLHHVDLPAVEEELSEARRDVRRSRIRGHSTRCMYMIEEAEAAEEEGQLADATGHYREAASALKDAVSVLDADALSNSLSDAEVTAPPELLPTILDRLNDCCERALNEADGTARTAIWGTILDGYQTLVDVASTLESADVEVPDLEFQRSWVAQQLAEAIEEATDELEATADDRYDDGDAEAARNRYEQAVTLLERRRALVGNYGAIDPIEDDERMDRLEEKLGRTEWEWVGDQ